MQQTIFWGPWVYQMENLVKLLFTLLSYCFHLDKKQFDSSKGRFRRRQSKFQKAVRFRRHAICKQILRPLGACVELSESEKESET